ncbi:hypothetical protein [Taibaiella koreensis]|uniref:hypothetical protein n=1 Tax=Taibaiella koreensis TaxID=1268548 RepID=UPI000E5A0172|nr:hypothetical protein [Taibaiella koreensis]
MIKASLVMALPALMLFSCKKETIDYTKDNNPYNKTGILPLSNGNRWFYKVTYYGQDNQPAFSLDDSLSCSNEGWSPSVYYFPGHVLQGSYSNRDANALQVVGGSDYFKATNQDEVLWDKVENGYHYIRKAFAGPQKVNGYDAYKNLVTGINDATKDTVIEQYFYFAKGIGIVKQESMDFNGGRHLGQVYDLTAYTVK